MSQTANAKTIFSNPIHWLAFGFGSGLAPKAPGTFGTLAAIPIVLLLADVSLPVYAIICLVMCVTGIFICDYSAKQLGVHDHPGIVWDEIAGFCIAMLGFSVNWYNLLIAFILFRIFDILKPWPIKWADKQVNGGLGIMLDDIIAGIFAWLGLYGVHWLWLGSY